MFVIKVTNKELALFQHKLEEEVKKDQKEKKANQDVLRSLKVEIEELVETQGRLVPSLGPYSIYLLKHLNMDQGILCT